MEPSVLYRADGGVAVVTLNRPAARNAVNPALAAELEEAVDRIEADDAIRAAVLTAETAGQTTPVFCAGADLKAVAAGERDRLFTARGSFGGFVFRERSKPFVAAVDGMAIAGGAELVLACDLAVASRRSSFAFFEVTRNLVAGAGALFRLPRAVGKATALDLLLSGEPISAQRAYELGMVSRLSADGEALRDATALAARIAANAPVAVRLTRRLVLASENDSDEEVKAQTAEAVAIVTASDDLKEGVAAFIERRAPRWTGT